MLEVGGRDVAVRCGGATCAEVAAGSGSRGARGADAAGKGGGAWRLLREFQADAHALVVTEERRHERKVVVAHLSQQGRSRAEDTEEFIGLEEEGNAVAVADYLGLEVEESAHELEMERFRLGVEAISSAHVAAAECGGEGFVCLKIETGHTFADAVVLELLIYFGFDGTGCCHSAGLCQKVLTFEGTLDAIVGPIADEIAFCYAAAAEDVGEKIGEHPAAGVESRECVGGVALSCIEYVAGGGEKQRGRESEGCND